MNIFTKKGTIQKTIIAILMVLCINFIVPTYSHAGIGGVLINPILDLAASLGDIVESLLQWSMTGQFAAGEKLSESKILVDQGDNRIKNGSGDSTISVSTDELDLGWFTNSNNYQVPIIEYTPEEIFSNKIPYLDINFINPTWTSQNSHYGIDGIAAELQETIAGWYIALRNLAIVGLLCVLVYVGIRILLSSTANDKAKFKTMFTDWLIALCILFFLHYIMSFTLTMVNSVNNALTGGQTYQSNGVVIEVDGAKYATNFMGAARFMVQSKDTVERFGYLLIYLALVAYTVMFTWHYLKRVLMMAFLTIIAPLVALTYPIDKIGDGTAQAFNMWLKEYVYNALIQPFHLIVYMIFVGSAIDFAKTNMIYALVAVGFILPAEKLLKRMFGFDKGPLGTMGALTGFAAGSLASKFGSGKGSSGGQKGGNGQDENKPPRYERHHGTDGIDYAEDHALDGSSPQNPNELRTPTGGVNEEQQTESALPDSRGLPFDDAIDVPYREVPLESNSENQQQNPSENGPFQRLSDDDVEEMAPERPRTMDDVEQNNSRQSSESSQQEQRSTRNNIRQPGRVRQGMRNIVNKHGGGKGILKNAAKTLGKASKFTARTAFTVAGMAAGAGAGLASGKGFGGVIAGATAGKNLGRRLGTTISNMPENAYNLGRNVVNKVGGAVTEEIDTFNGNTRLHDKAEARRFMKDSSTEQYVREKLTADNNGRAPSEKQVKEEMSNIKMYANEGMTDIGAIYRAKKAEKFGVDPDQAAKIALLAQDRKITSDVLGDEKKYKARQEDFTQEFMDKGLSEAQAAAKADYVLNVMKAQVGQRHNLRNVGGRAQVVQPTQNNNTDGAQTARGPRTQNNNPDGGATRRTRTQNNNQDGGATRRTRTQNNNPNGGATRRPRTQNNNPNGGTTRRGRPRTQNNNSDPSGSNN